MTFIEYPDREFMMMALCDQIAQELRQGLEQQDRVTLSVPGGTTPGPVFDLLSGLDLGWDRIDVLLNDERWVAEDNARSNTRLIRERLLQGYAAKARLIPLYTPVATPEDGLPALEPAVQAVLPITVLILGMGADMHTASLFPGADLLEQAMAPDAPVLMALRAEAAGEPRITLSAHVLRDAMHCHILITGADKRAAIERAQSLPDLQAPVRCVLDNASIHWAP